MVVAIAGAATAQGRGSRFGQQDRPGDLDDDGARRGIPAAAGDCLTASRRQRGKCTREDGDRSNRRRTAIRPGSTAIEAAELFGCSSRKPTGPAAMTPRQKAGHMTAFVPSPILLISHLNLGPFHTERCFDLAPAVFSGGHGSDKHGVTERDPPQGASRPSFGTGDCPKDEFVA